MYSEQTWDAQPYQPNFYRPQIGYQPLSHPLSSGFLPQHEVSYQVNGIDQQEQANMEAAFEKALDDARAQSSKTVEVDGEEMEEIVRDDVNRENGDFEAVWESLRPEAERLGKLAEWEKDFSQVSSVPQGLVFSSLISI